MSTGYKRFNNEPGSVATYPPGYVHQGAPNVQVRGQQTIVHTTVVAAPEDYYFFAKFVTFFCFWPLGIVALFKSAQVRKRIAKGDIEGALQSSAEAKKFSWIGCIVGGIAILVTGLFFLGMYISNGF